MRHNFTQFFQIKLSFFMINIVIDKNTWMHAKFSINNYKSK